MKIQATPNYATAIETYFRLHKIEKMIQLNYFSKNKLTVQVYTLLKINNKKHVSGLKSCYQINKIQRDKIV